jgi:hypothetical protein
MRSCGGPEGHLAGGRAIGGDDGTSESYQLGVLLQRVGDVLNSAARPGVETTA